jgi:hypothetical protein
MLGAALALTAAGSGVADIGPKPTMSFDVAFDRPGLTIASGSLLMCSEATCADAAPLKRLGPQGFDCDATSCFARAYGFAAFGRLVITLSDGRTLKSNVFARAGFDARYRAVVRAGALSVHPE